MSILPESWNKPPAAGDLAIIADNVDPDRRWRIPRYGEDRWALSALIKNPSATVDYITWPKFPDATREDFRHAAWALINFPLTQTQVRLHGAPMREKLSAGRMYKTVHQWAIFAGWLESRGIASLAAITVEDLVDYSRYLAMDRGLNRNTACSHLICLSRLHYYSTAHLPAGGRLVEPPWTLQGLDEFLPAASAHGENLTDPISPKTMGPLLVWALRFTELFAPDILAACAERRRVVDAARALEDEPLPRGGDGERIVAYLEGLKATAAPVPVLANYEARPAAVQVLAALTRTHPERVRTTMAKPQWREYMQANWTPAVLDGVIAGRLDGAQWHGPIGFEQATTLRKHLVAACFIVIAYLTGMRPGEVLALEAGCCPDPGGQPGAPAHHLIYGRQFKTARDADGNHLSVGVVREAPWVAVPQVVNAVRVLEQVVPGGLLFGATAHDPRSPQLREGRSLAESAISNRIRDFIAFVNDYAADHGRDGEMIPPDDDRFIGVGRFRRTLAWHIARRPGGLVALAVQYGHMRTVISESYASRSRDGIYDLLDYETARAMAERLSEVHDALEEGDGVSGPAARRLVHAAEHEHHVFGGMITTKRQAAKLLADPTLNVYENKEAYLMCNYDRSKALCDPGRGPGTGAPSLDRCRSTCANIARTDQQVDDMRAHVLRLRAQAESPMAPAPIADRLREKALEYERLAERHDRDRITRQEDGQ